MSDVVARENVLTERNSISIQKGVYLLVMKSEVKH